MQSPQKHFEPRQSAKTDQRESRPECDFCGDQVAAVRRVALDHEYDRLQKGHRALYSCASCFEKKEQKRLGLSALR